MLIKPKKSKNSYSKDCRAYLEYKVGKKCYGKVSLLCVGEIVKAISVQEAKDQWETQKERSNILSDLLLILDKKSIDFWSPQFGCMEKALKINEDNQYEPADTLHLSCASQDEDCSVFVTLEDDLINNKYLEKLLNIKIKHPSAI